MAHSRILVLKQGKINITRKNYEDQHGVIEADDLDDGSWSGFADYVTDDDDTTESIEDFVDMLRQSDPEVKLIQKTKDSIPFVHVTAKCLENRLRQRYEAYNSIKDLTFEQFAGISDTGASPYEVGEALNGDDFDYHIVDEDGDGMNSFDDWVQEQYAQMSENHEPALDFSVLNSIDYHF